MIGNMTVADMVFNIMSTLRTGHFTVNYVRVNDINTLMSLYSIKSNTTECSKFVKMLIAQNRDNDFTKMMAINTKNSKGCDIVMATDSKFPAMKNMIRRISNIYDQYSKIYGAADMHVVIDGVDYSENASAGRLLNYVMVNEPTLFGKRIAKVNATLNVDRDFVNKKFKCKISVVIICEEED